MRGGGRCGEGVTWEMWGGGHMGDVGRGSHGRCGEGVTWEMWGGGHMGDVGRGSHEEIKDPQDTSYV